MTQWERNAHIVEDVYGGYVDWEEGFYECPECGEIIYGSDWSHSELANYLCPICEFEGDEEL